MAEADCALTELGEFPHANEQCPRLPESFGGDVLAWFKHLREDAPVYRDEKGVYVLSRYDDIYAALNNPAAFSSDQELEVCSFAPLNVRSIVYADDPDHLDARKLVNRAWTPGAVLELQAGIERHVEELVAGLSADEPFDAVDLGMQIAQRSFSEAMGLSPEEHPRIANWLISSGAFVRPEKMMLNTGRPRPGDDEREALYASGIPDLQAYFGDVVEKYGSMDQPALKAAAVPPFPRAIAAAAQKDPRNIEVIATQIMPPLLAGGVSTLSHVFPNSLDVLLDRPDVWSKLRADPTLLDISGRADAVEELLRLRGVVQGMPRVAKTDIEIRGMTIPAGSLVQLYYLSAGRDEEAFPDADQFCERGLSRHLTFGFGSHTCMGQSLVRLELKIFLRTLSRRFVRVERVPFDADWGGVGVYYTPDRLPVVGRED